MSEYRTHTFTHKDVRYKLQTTRTQITGNCGISGVAGSLSCLQTETQWGESWSTEINPKKIVSIIEDTDALIKPLFYEGDQEKSMIVMSSRVNNPSYSDPLIDAFMKQKRHLVIPMPLMVNVAHPYPDSVIQMIVIIRDINRDKIMSPFSMQVESSVPLNPKFEELKDEATTGIERWLNLLKRPLV